MRLEAGRLWLSPPRLADAGEPLWFLGDAVAMLADLRTCRRARASTWSAKQERSYEKNVSPTILK